MSAAEKKAHYANSGIPKAVKNPAVQQTEEGKNPKQALNEGMATLMGRCLSKGEVEYQSKSFGMHKYASTVILHSLGGSRHHGAEQQLKEDAERSAALVAWAAIKPQVEAKKAEPKKKATPAEKAAKKAQVGELGAAAAVNPAHSPKMQMNEVVTKIAGRVPSKGEIAYSAQQTTLGFQATVVVPLLPGEWASRMWVGEVKSNKADAEQSAAEQCLKTLQSAPELVEKLEAFQKKKAKSKPQNARSSASSSAGGDGTEGGEKKEGGGKRKASQDYWDESWDDVNPLQLLAAALSQSWGWNKKRRW